ncbi:hypothetical protein RvY_10970-3 [Ramazzottius varieornatus]|uniref:Uncharacterized protein n=1 Tax=Ramazzottius varieornatus TaxID=947166 RepID=A0A1D1VNH6_RAMVA|nr:hypothetical protein RvY_10970-3 [Ramazzottius varieornatus]
MAEGGQIPRRHDADLPRELRDDHHLSARPARHLYQANSLIEAEYREMRELIPASAAFDGQSLFVPSIEKCLLRGYSRAPPVQGFLAMAHLDIVPLRYWVHVSQPDCGASDDRSSFLHGDCVYYLDGLVGNGHRSSWVTVSPLRVAKQVR